MGSRIQMCGEMLAEDRKVASSRARVLNASSEWLTVRMATIRTRGHGRLFSESGGVDHPDAVIVSNLWCRSSFTVRPLLSCSPPLLLVYEERQATLFSLTNPCCSASLAYKNAGHTPARRIIGYFFVPDNSQCIFIQHF